MEVNWQKVLELDYIYELNCWESGCGGHCCNLNSEEFDFRFMPKLGVNIIYLKGEYEFLQDFGVLPPEKVKKFSFDFNGPQALEFYYHNCTHLGLCKGKMTKPLSCRMYPYVPSYKSDRQLAGLTEASVIDMTMMVRGDKYLCNISRADRYRAYYESTEIKDVLCKPGLMLNFMALKLFYDSYQFELKQNTELMRLEGRQFWKNWEMAYFMGKLVNKRELKDKLLAYYQELIGVYGEFKF